MIGGKQMKLENYLERRKSNLNLLKEQEDLLIEIVAAFLKIQNNEILLEEINDGMAVHIEKPTEGIPANRITNLEDYIEARAEIVDYGNQPEKMSIILYKR